MPAHLQGAPLALYSLRRKGDEREGDYVPVSGGKQSEEAWMKKPPGAYLTRIKFI